MHRSAGSTEAGCTTGRPPPGAVASGADRSRTYQVRTYGCQMNVHDSERLSGLLEEAGYAARRRRRSRTWWCSTPARSGRTPTTGSTATSATCAGEGRAPRHADRRRRLPGPEGPRRDRPAGALGRRRLRHPQHRLAAGAAGAGPAQRRARRSRSLESLEVFPSTLPTRRESTYAGLGVDLRRLQQHLHLLHRAVRCAARRRTGAPATSSPRSRRWSPRACSRSPCSGRTSTPTASSSATGRRSASCCAPAARSTGWSGSGSPARTPRTSPTT